MKRDIILVSAIVSMTATGALAQSSADWTGFYGGLQVGYLDVDTNISGVDGSGALGGIILGYDLDLGDWVVGAGFDYDWTGIDVAPGVEVESVWRIKGRAGYKVTSQGLLYGTAGFAEAETDNIGSDDGWFIGAGYEQIVAPNVSIGGEILYHEFDDFDSTGIDVDATSIQARASYRF